MLLSTCLHKKHWLAPTWPTPQFVRVTGWGPSRRSGNHQDQCRLCRPCDNERGRGFQGFIAGEDSAPVRNLKKSGAIIFGRTNVPAFSTRYFTDNDLHGRTFNPYDPARTPVDQVAAPPPQSPSVLDRSRTETIERVRSAIPPMRAGSRDCGRQLAACPISTLATARSAGSRLSSRTCKGRWREMSRLANCAWGVGGVRSPRPLVEPGPAGHQSGPGTGQSGDIRVSCRELRLILP